MKSAKPTAYTTLAAWQLMEGAFNINSTSVAAWKAMLASIHDSQALFNQLNKADNTSKLATLHRHRPRARSPHQPVPPAGGRIRRGQPRRSQGRLLARPARIFGRRTADARRKHRQAGPPARPVPFAGGIRQPPPGLRRYRPARRPATGDRRFGAQPEARQRRQRGLRDSRRPGGQLQIRQRRRRRRPELSGRAGLPHPGRPAQCAGQCRHRALRHLHHPRLRRGPRRQPAKSWPRPPARPSSNAIPNSSTPPTRWRPPPTSSQARRTRPSAAAS